MEEYHRATLSNGLRLLVTPLPHLHSVEVICYVGVGVRNESPDLAGVSHFLEHMVFRGNENNPSGPLIEQAFECLGGAVNAATDAETTIYDANIHPDSVSEAISLFAELLIAPLFPGLETERSIVLEEALADFNEGGDDICPDNRMAKMIWGDHSLALPVIGFPDTIRQFTLDDLKRWHQQYYVPGNVVISVAGPVDFVEVRSAVERAFGAWSGDDVLSPVRYNAPPVGDGPRSCWVRDSGSQLALQLAWRTDGSLSPTSMGTRVLRRILGDGGASRLMQRLREESGLTYSVEASLEEYAETGCLSIDLAIDPEKLIAAVKTLLEEMARALQPIPVDELQRVVTTGLYRLHFSRDDVEELAVRYGWGEINNNMHTLRDDTDAWQRVTPALVQEAAVACLRKDRLYFVCIGPWREQDRTLVEAMLDGLKATDYE
ncbi:MAG: pitrilysin family protein [Thermodesulfobacteriota bacterium]|nr:pitrilysin family protein [Thermodesulfobacteriota bacterium]